MPKATKKIKELGIELTDKQIKFCHEYVMDWNGARAARVAGYSEDTAREIARQLLTKLDIKAYIEKIKNDYEKLCGISKAKIIDEHRKLAFNSIAHLHNTWIERKEFDELTDDQKACIAEISTQTRTEKRNDELYEVEFVKIKLYDKQKSLDSIAKLMGYDAPIKTDLSGSIQVIFDEDDMRVCRGPQNN